jgi:hypothetical protein
MGLEAILTVSQRLTRIARVRINGGDDPVRGDALGDAPAPIGTV